MSKGLCNMSKAERDLAITRRISSGTKGLGYWAAIDAIARREELRKLANAIADAMAKEQGQ